MRTAPDEAQRATGNRGRRRHSRPPHTRRSTRSRLARPCSPSGRRHRRRAARFAPSRSARRMPAGGQSLRSRASPRYVTSCSPPSASNRSGRQRHRRRPGVPPGLPTSARRPISRPTPFPATRPHEFPTGVFRVRRRSPGPYAPSRAPPPPSRTLPPAFSVARDVRLPVPWPVTSASQCRGPWHQLPELSALAATAKVAGYVVLTPDRRGVDDHGCRRGRTGDADGRERLAVLE